MKVPTGYHGHARDLVRESLATGTKLVSRAGVEITPNVKIYPRTDGRIVIFDKRLPLGENAGVFDDDATALREARRIYASELGGAKGPVKKFSSADEEAFANMKIAMANGFAVHEPAYSAEELAALNRKEVGS